MLFVNVRGRQEILLDPAGQTDGHALLVDRTKPRGYRYGAGATGPQGAPGADGADADVSAAWPVGSVFIAAVGTDPATLLGFGTWEPFAAGRVLVGLDATQTEFDTLEETGGEKTHVLTASEVPS